MLKELTQQQEALMYEARDEYLNMIFDCNTTLDKNAAKDGIEWLYRSSGLNVPMIVWVDSPLAAQYMLNILKALFNSNVEANVRANVWDNVRANVEANVGANVWDNVRANVWANVEANVGDNVRANVRDNVGANVRANVGDNVGANVEANVRANVEANVWVNIWDNVGANVWDNVWANVWANVEANVRANVWDNVGANVWDNVRANVEANVRANVGDDSFVFEQFSQYGSVCDYGWVAFYDFFTRVGVLNHDGFNKFRSLVRSGVYDMIQLDGLCIVCGLPSKINRDQDGQMHSTSDFAIEWQDGYKLNYVNGRFIEADLFNKVVNSEYSFNEFQKLDNEDVKAAIVTIIKENKGNEGLLEFLGAECVDEKSIVHDGGYIEKQRLYKTKDRFEWANDSKGNSNVQLAWNEMTCPSTGSTYLIETCPSFTDVIESAKWLRPSQVPQSLQYKWLSAN